MQLPHRVDQAGRYLSLTHKLLCDIEFDDESRQKFIIHVDCLSQAFGFYKKKKDGFQKSKLCEIQKWTEEEDDNDTTTTTIAITTHNDKHNKRHNNTDTQTMTAAFINNIATKTKKTKQEVSSLWYVCVCLAVSRYWYSLWYMDREMCVCV